MAQEERIPAHTPVVIRCEPEKPRLGERPLLERDQAAQLTTLFKVLANDSRLRVLHALVKAEELSVGELAAQVEMTPQAVSNHLQRLVDRGILSSRRVGNNIFYRIVDACTVAVLDVGLCLVEDASPLNLERLVAISR